MERPGKKFSKISFVEVLVEVSILNWIIMNIVYIKYSILSILLDKMVFFFIYKSMDKFICFLAKFAYTVGCICLYLISLWIIVAAVVGIYIDVTASKFTIYKLLDEVALIVFSIAVIDVSKYLMTEEVLKEKDSSPKEARRSFTKFVIIIVTALALEALVITIETVKTDISKLIYPILMFITATIFLIGLGVYQRLNAASEKR